MSVAASSYIAITGLMTSRRVATACHFLTSAAYYGRDAGAARRKVGFQKEAFVAPSSAMG